MLKAQNSKFHDFGNLGRVQTPQNQYDLSLETPGHLKQNQENNLEHFRNILFYKYGIRFF